MMPENHPVGKQTCLPGGREDLDRAAWGLTLKVARIVAGYASQSEFAAKIGIPNSSLSRYEAGKKVPTERTTLRIAAGVGIPLTLLQTVLFPAVRSAVAVMQGLRPRRDSSQLADAALAALLGPLSNALTWMVERLQDRFEGGWRDGVPPSPKDRADAPALLRVLLESTPHHQQLLLAETREFRSWAVCELVCAESLKAAPDSAEHSRKLAELAVAIANLCPGDEAWRRRVRGYAGVHLGTAQRVGGQIQIADTTFTGSMALWESGILADPGLLDEALVKGLFASLRIEQRRPADALTLLAQALTCDFGKLRPHLLVNRARAFEQLGDFAGAVATLQEAAPLVRSDAEPRLHWVLQFNLLSNLCHLCRFEEAATLLPGVQSLAAELGNELDLLRTRGLTGWVAAGQGRRAEAIELLEGVRAEFAARKIAYDTALVTLELAVLYLEEGRTAEVTALAVELAWIFEAEGVHREALAALNLFCEAARREALSLELARRVGEYLYRARENPELSLTNDRARAAGSGPPSRF